MTDCAGNPNAHQLSMLEPASHPDDRAGFEQFDCCFGLIEADMAAFDCLKENLWQLVHVHLKPELERLPRGQARPYPSKLFPEDRLMKAELAAPVCFAAESVVAENLLALAVKAFGVGPGYLAEGCVGDTLGLGGWVRLDLARIIETSRANCE